MNNFKVDLTAFKGQSVDVYVLDFYERTVFQTNTNGQNIQLNAQNWASGNYLLLIRSADGSTAAQNIVKQ